MSSRSIPLDPDGVAVTVTATEATRENSTRDASMTTHMMPREGDVCRRRWGCEFSAPVPGSSSDGGYETNCSRTTSDGAFPRRRFDYRAAQTDRPLWNPHDSFLSIRTEVAS
jgi:hypothetical protein